jgi:hypothetical protein
MQRPRHTWLRLRSARRSAASEQHPRLFERQTVRVLIVLILAAAITAALTVGVPTKIAKPGKLQPDLPAIALGQTSVYRLEIGLAVFYAALLVAVPVVVGIYRGRLPSEISARGVKVGDEIVATEAATEKRLQTVEGRLTAIEKRGDPL